MTDSNALSAWLRLWRTPGIGPKAFHSLLRQFESPAAVLAADSAQLQQAGLKPALIKTLSKQSVNHQKNAETGVNEDPIEADLSWLESSDLHHIITLADPRYPSLLKQIADPPPLIYVHGDPDVLQDPQLAIVGSRNPTRGGSSNADDFSRFLAKSGLVITSGLALGIDGIAHRGALDSGAPTVAVIATGIDRVYPSHHRDLAHQIVKQGAIVSEFPLGTQPRAENFPRRNRIISGLSYGTLIVEAALRSGSLITARCANEQGREVFAIPGSIHNPLARGCHRLIREGAKLVERGQDIFEEMASLIHLPEQPNSVEQNQSPFASAINRQRKSGVQTDRRESGDSAVQALDSEQSDLLDLMGFDPIGIDQLVASSGKPAEQVSSMILMLELMDYVSSEGGGIYLRHR